MTLTQRNREALGLLHRAAQALSDDEPAYTGQLQRRAAWVLLRPAFWPVPVTDLSALDAQKERHRRRHG